MANQTWVPITNRTWVGPPNQTWTQTLGNRTWIDPSNQTWTQTLGNQTHVREGLPPGLANGWAHSNMSIGARNITQPVLMNGTYHVTLGYVAINSTSSGQIISNIALNESIAQVEFDHNGSVQLIIKSSAKPAHVYADSLELSEVQSTSGLTPESEAWVYDQNTHTLIIFADPSSVTIIYGSTETPIPEFPPAVGLVLIVSLAVSAIVVKRRSSRQDQVANFPERYFGGPVRESQNLASITV